MLKECSNEISPILALIFNESLAQGDVTDKWRLANVSLVFKKGEKYDAANYRPVSPTCICCKTVELILVSNINKHLALDSIPADCQHGFRSQRSCETQLVQFVHDIISNLDGAVNRGHKQTYYSPFLKTWEIFACRHSSGIWPRAKDSFNFTRSLFHMCKIAMFCYYVLSSDSKLNILAANKV